MRRGGAGPKLINNALTLLGQSLRPRHPHAARAAPTLSGRVRRPRVEQSDSHSFLDQPSLMHFCAPPRATPDRVTLSHRRDDRAAPRRVARAALARRRLAGRRARVRRTYVRGDCGTPKSRRSSRAVPMADRLAGELDRHRSSATATRRRRPRVRPSPDRGTVPTPRTWRAASTAPCERRVAGATCASTTSATPSGRGWPRRRARCARLQEWMGHRDFKTTLIYADYAAVRARSRS